MKYNIPDHIKTGIYKITNTINDKIYIGSACDLMKRYRSHISAFNRKDHHNNQLSKFVEIYSIENLNFEIIEECLIEVLHDREQVYIDVNKKNIFNESYNTRSVNRGKQLSEEHKSNISKALKGYKQTEEHKLNIGKALKGKAGKYFRTQEFKNELSLKIKNNKERSQNISKATKGKHLGKNKGRHHTEETKQKISKKNKNKNLKPIIQYDLQDNFIKEWNSISEAALFFNPNNMGAARSSISDCLRNKTKTSNKFKWKYKSQI